MKRTNEWMNKWRKKRINEQGKLGRWWQISEGVVAASTIKKLSSCKTKWMSFVFVLKGSAKIITLTIVQRLEVHMERISLNDIKQTLNSNKTVQNKSLSLILFMKHFRRNTKSSLMYK